MKKTLIAIIAIMLVVVLCFTLFACNKDKDKDKDKTNNSGTGTDTGKEQTPTAKELTWEELGDNEADTVLLLTFADQYLTNGATAELNNSVALQAALQAKADDMEGKVLTVAVSLEDDGCYTIKFTYQNQDTYTYHVANELKARVSEPGEYAGYEMGTNAVDFDKSLGTVYSAFLRTVQKAIENGTDFGEGYTASAKAGEKKSDLTFGGSVEAAFTFNYGVGDGQIGPMSYGLKIYGTLGYEAADTEVAIEVIDEKEDEIVGGLYYKDATLFLSLNVDDYQQKLYLDNADINAIVGSMLGDIWNKECVHTYKDGYCTKCGKVEPETSDEEPFYMHEANYSKITEALKDLTGGNSMVTTVVNIVKPLLASTKTTVGGNDRYQYQINLDMLIDKLINNAIIGPMISTAVNPIIKSILPELQLESFQGVGGMLTLSFDVTKGDDATLAGVQISYNVAQKDFRWNKDDTEQKLYGPVNVAVTVSDFAIGDQTVEKDKVNKNKYTYFSPLNGEITADITYADANSDEFDGDYKLYARADFNPFTLFAGGENREGKAEIILNKVNAGTEDAFFHVYIHDFTYKNDKWDSVVTVYYDGTYYETKASESDFFTKVFKDFILPLVDNDEKTAASNLEPISDYVWELINQFSKEYTAASFDKDVKALKDEITALEVTEHAYEITKDKDGKEVKKDLGVMPGSTFLDEIKSNALEQIDIIVRGVADTSDARKAAIKDIKSVVKTAKSDYKAQLKLEGKADSLFEGFDIVKLASNFSALKGLFIGEEGAANPKVFDYVISLDDPQIHADLDYKVYNSVIDILKLAIPKLNDFTSDAATVKVEMNTAKYKYKLWVNVEYGDYYVDVLVDLGECFTKGAQGVEFSLNGHKMVADIEIRIPDESSKVIKYFYNVTAEFGDWDKNKGKINISFKESDGERATEAKDEFVKLEITQSWEGDKYKGFDAKLTLKSRKADGSLNDAHVYNVSGKEDDGMYLLTIDECDITLGIGNFDGGVDKKNTLSFKIPAPWCNVSFVFDMGDRDVKIDVKNLKIAKWGSKMVDNEGISLIEGIDTNGKDVVRNSADSKAMDNGLYDVVVDVLGGYFYTTPQA